MISGRTPPSDQNDDTQEGRTQKGNPVVLAEGPQVTKVTELSHDNKKLEMIVRDKVSRLRSWNVLFC